MPNVSEEFVKKAQALATAVPTLLEKVQNSEKQASTASEELQHQAEMAADTLVSHGLVPESEKSAAVSQLLDHSRALSLLNKTAGYVGEAPSMGAPAETSSVEKEAGHDDSVRESDRVLLGALGFNI